MVDPTAERRCTQCDTRVGPGRFCAHCGAPVSEGLRAEAVGADAADDAGHEVWRTDTAERPRVAVPDGGPQRAGAPPQPFDLPPPPRFPLYADDVARPAPEPTEPPSDPPSEPGMPPDDPMPVPRSAGFSGTPGSALWIGVAAVLLTALLVGGWLLLHGSPAGGTNGQSSSRAAHRTHHSGSTSAQQSPSTGEATGPTNSPTAAGTTTEVAGLARASAPTHAPSGVDVGGQPVTFVASNLIDGSVTTCWRTAGDATGTVLTIRLDQPTTLSGVGLVNGYAKIARAAGHRFDWYTGNRRVLSVDWVFDDGSQVSQQFQSSRRMQQMKINPVTTSTVRIQITSVSAPGRGRAARNDTAVSEVSLLGRPAS